MPQAGSPARMVERAELGHDSVIGLFHPQAPGQLPSGLCFPSLVSHVLSPVVTRHCLWRVSFGRVAFEPAWEPSQPMLLSPGRTALAPWSPQDQKARLQGHTADCASKAPPCSRRLRGGGSSIGGPGTREVASARLGCCEVERLLARGCSSGSCAALWKRRCPVTWAGPISYTSVFSCTI